MRKKLTASQEQVQTVEAQCRNMGSELESLTAQLNELTLSAQHQDHVSAIQQQVYIAILFELRC